MNKKIYQLVSVFAAFILVFGNSYNAGASSAVRQAVALPALGFGANTISGQGGAVYEVNNTNDSGKGSSMSFVETQTGFRFASIGDAHVEVANFTKTVNQIKSLTPSFILFNGDLENDGVVNTQMDPMINILKAANLYNNTFFVRGNHDDHLSGSASLWQNYFTTAARPLPAGVTNYVGIDSTSTYLTYSFDYGNSRFIGLDSNQNADPPTSAQYTFLDQRLTDAENKILNPNLEHAFIFFHAPEYCVESTHCGCQTVTGCANSTFTSIINKHPIVSATFHGHEHILGWTHMSSARVPSLTHEYEQFITSPSGNYYGYTAYPNRLDYYSADNYLAFGSIDVNGPSFTVNLYHVGSTTPTLEWSKTFTKSGAGRPMKYYGVDRGSPFTDANYATLAQHAVKTIIVDTFINDASNSSSASWSNIKALASKYNFNYVIWPNQGGDVPGCGWETPFNSPQSGNYIWRVTTMLDSFATDPHFIGMVSAHEPMWNTSTCKTSISDMASIKTQLKNYMQTKGRADFKVWNYIDNVSDLKDMSGFVNADIERVMDVAVTWQHCFGGAEGTCSDAKNKIIADRALIDNAGLNGKVDLVYLFQTFAADGGYSMPTLADMQAWDCQFIATNALDGFLYYTWGAWYSTDLINHPELWPEMNRVYDSCVNQAGSQAGPKVVSSVLANISPTTAGRVQFTVSFSEAVIGVDINDFSLATSGVSGASIASVSGSGSIYTVTVNTGSGNGTIRLDVVDNNSILDAASNPLGGAAVGDGNFTSGETYSKNIITDTWAVQVSPATDPNQLALQLGAQNLGQIGSLTGYYLFRIPGSNTQPKTATDLLAANSQVLWFEQQTAQQQSTREYSNEGNLVDTITATMDNVQSQNNADNASATNILPGSTQTAITIIQSFPMSSQSPMFTQTPVAQIQPSSIPTTSVQSTPNKPSLIHSTIPSTDSENNSGNGGLVVAILITLSIAAGGIFLTLRRVK